MSLKAIILMLQKVIFSFSVTKTNSFSITQKKSILMLQKLSFCNFTETELFKITETDYFNVTKYVTNSEFYNARYVIAMAEK